MILQYSSEIINLFFEYCVFIGNAIFKATPKYIFRLNSPSSIVDTLNLLREGHFLPYKILNLYYNKICIFSEAVYLVVNPV